MQGYDTALGTIYERGTQHYEAGSFRLAWEWFNAAAECGLQDAICSIGIMYSKGEFVPYSLKAAYATFNRIPHNKIAQCFLGKKVPHM